METQVFLSRKVHDRTLPWGPEVMRLLRYAKRADSLAGFMFTFPNVYMAMSFRMALGIAGDE